MAALSFAANFWLLATKAALSSATSAFKSSFSILSTAAAAIGKYLIKSVSLSSWSSCKSSTKTFNLTLGMVKATFSMGLR